MNKSVYKMIIKAPLEDTWEVLFNQYGDIHIHNPTMITSNYMDGATKGELNCVRHCKFSEKLCMNEKITEVNEQENLTIVVTEHNLPFVKEMSATYSVLSIASNETALEMTSYNSFSPGFMKYLMRGQLAKSLAKHLFGMKYYIETGKIVDKKNYSRIYRDYHKI